MKTKIIAVIVALNASFCTAMLAQSSNPSNSLRGGNGNSNNGNIVNTPPVATPTPAPTSQPNLNGNLLSQQNLQIVLNQVAKSKEYQNLKKNVTTKVNNSKVGKKVSGFTRFLQNIGLAKKPVVPKKTTK